MSKDTRDVAHLLHVPSLLDEITRLRAERDAAITDRNELAAAVEGMAEWNVNLIFLAREVLARIREES